MNINESDISILQLSDSFFPTGLYTMSSGLETFFDDKIISNGKQIKSFIETIISQQFGPADCIALANAYDFAVSSDIEGIIKCDKALYSMKLVKESRDASCMTGSQMIKCVAVFSKNQLLHKFLESLKKSNTPSTHPIAIAVCSVTLGIPKKKALQMLLYGLCVSIVGASLRLGILDHIQSQEILHSMKPLITQSVDNYAEKKLDEMWQFSPEYDIVQMKHEQKFSKMFVT